MIDPIFRRFVPLAVFALVGAGCATAVPPVEVTRFHAVDTGWTQEKIYSVDPQPLTGAIDNPLGAPSQLEWSTYRTAVERQLQLNGFVVADPARESAAPFRLRLGIERAESVTPRRSPVSIGVGGGTGGYGSGVGVGVGFNLGGGRRAMTDLRLVVRLDDVATGQAVWEGRAETSVANASPAAQPSLAAAKLAEALFKDFPGESGRTISVP